MLPEDMTVNGVGDREAVKSPGYFKMVRIQEKATVASFPTVEFNVSNVASGGSYEHKKLGESHVFTSPTCYVTGEVVGYVETALSDGTPSGSSTFEKIGEF